MSGYFRYLLGFMLVMVVFSTIQDPERTGRAVGRVVHAFREEIGR